MNVARTERIVMKKLLAIAALGTAIALTANPAFAAPDITMERPSGPPSSDRIAATFTNQIRKGISLIRIRIENCTCRSFPGDQPPYRAVRSSVWPSHF
jgi:hypothetical protein